MSVEKILMKVPREPPSIIISRPTTPRGGVLDTSMELAVTPETPKTTGRRVSSLVDLSAEESEGDRGHEAKKQKYSKFL